MRSFFVLFAIALNLWVGLPCLFFGVIGLSGGLADVSVNENLAIGAKLLSVTFLIGGSTVIWLTKVRPLQVLSNPPDEPKK